MEHLSARPCIYHLVYLFKFSQQFCGILTLRIPVLQIKQLRLKEIEQLALQYPAIAELGFKPW